MKRIILVYVLAFTANWIWEILHSILYLNYKGGIISNFILFRAALTDAVMVLILVFISQKFGKYKTTFILVGGLIIAVVIEIWALQTGRWTYNSLMPIIPFVKIGFTPVIQLAITAYITEKIIHGSKIQKVYKSGI